MPADSPMYWAYLSREEWQFLYALSFSYQLLDILPVRNLDHSFRDIIRDLYRADGGYAWGGLEVGEDDELYAKDPEEPLCPENLLFLAMMQRGLPPDYETHFAAAITFAAEHGLEHQEEMLRRGQVELAARNERHKASFASLTQAERDEIFLPFFERAVSDVKGGNGDN